MASSTDPSRDSSQDGLPRDLSRDSPPTPSSILSATNLTATADRTVPRHHLAVELSGLYSEIIAAKLWKVAEEYLEDDVSLPLCLTSLNCRTLMNMLIRQAEGSISVP